MIDNKIYFHHIPKTGGTSIAKSFSSHYNTENFWSTPLYFNAKIKECESSRKSLGRLLPSDFDESLFDNKLFVYDHFCFIDIIPEDYYKFTILRDPWEICVSLYKDLRRLKPSDIKDKKELVKLKSQELNLEEFLLYENSIINTTFNNPICKSLLCNSKTDSEEVIKKLYKFNRVFLLKDIKKAYSILESDLGIPDKTLNYIHANKTKEEVQYSKEFKEYFIKNNLEEDYKVYKEFNNTL